MSHLQVTVFTRTHVAPRCHEGLNVNITGLLMTWDDDINPTDDLIPQGTGRITRGWRPANLGVWTAGDERGLETSTDLSTNRLYSRPDLRSHRINFDSFFTLEDSRNAGNGSPPSRSARVGHGLSRPVEGQSRARCCHRQASAPSWSSPTSQYGKRALPI